ncbi:MAG: phosphatase PAP2 family protein, partial [Clostridiales bacterium]|nr:phosphatase PAP2 family protein [Clostridiales bacterium]
QGTIFITPLVILAVYLIGLFFKKEKYRTTAVNTGCIVILCLVIGLIIEQFVHETRPMFALNNVTILLPHSEDSSFPSDHMLFCFSTAFGFWTLSKKLSFSLMAFGLLVGIAKIYAAQHYPLDILFTILLVLLIYILYWLLISKRVSKLYLTLERRVLPFHK